jgi:ABC-2 type transport system permease protein
MDKFIAIFKREYMERVRTRAFVITTLIVPFFITIIFLLPAYLASRAGSSVGLTNIAILDATGTGLGARVSALLTADTSRASTAKAPDVRVVTAAQLKDAEQSASQEVIANQRTGYIVLTDNTVAGKSAHYEGRNASTIADMDKLSDAVRQGVQMTRLTQEGVKADRIDQLTHLSVHLETQRLDEKGRGEGEGRTAALVGFGIAFLLYMSIILHGQGVLRSVLEEKTTRVAEVVLSSVKPDTLLAGKVLGVGAVGLTQQVLWLAISAYMMQFFGPLLFKNAGAAAAGAGARGQALTAVFSGGMSISVFVAILGFFLVGFAFYATLFAAVGAMVNSEQEAQQAAQPVMILLVATILMVQAVLMNPTGTLGVVLSWIPFSLPIVMPMRMVMMPVPWYQVAASLGVGLLGCGVAVWLAARIYRVGMLMYGKRPSIPELVKWIRYA